MRKILTLLLFLCLLLLLPGCSRAELPPWMPDWAVDLLAPDEPSVEPSDEPSAEPSEPSEGSELSAPSVSDVTPSATSAPTAKPTATTKPTPSPKPTNPALPAEKITDFRSETVSEDELLSGKLVCVSNAHPWSFPKTKLVNIYANKSKGCYTLRAVDIELERECFKALDRLLVDFNAATGEKETNIIAGYRDLAYQQHLWDQSVERRGENYTKKYIASPGGSEHHTGLAFDLEIYRQKSGPEDFTNKGNRKWFYDHMAEYGFVQRYPEDKLSVTGIAEESWHFRYVGVPHASEMTRRKMCLEEYLSFLRAYTPNGDHLFLTEGGKNYEIWYCKADSVLVPASGSYTVSGDNLGGAIVTVTL